jgi:hypothetical protein
VAAQFLHLSRDLERAVEQVKTPAFETGDLPGLVTRTAWITSDSSPEDGNSRRVHREYLLFRTTEIASVEIEAILRSGRVSGGRTTPNCRGPIPCLRVTLADEADLRREQSSDLLSHLRCGNRLFISDWLTPKLWQ